MTRRYSGFSKTRETSRTHNATSAFPSLFFLYHLLPLSFSFSLVTVDFAVHPLCSHCLGNFEAVTTRELDIGGVATSI